MGRLDTSPENLLKLYNIGKHGGKVFVQIKPNGDRMDPQLLVKKVEGVPNGHVRIDRLDVKITFSSEFPQVIDDMSGPVNLFDDFIYSLNNKFFCIILFNKAVDQNL